MANDLQLGLGLSLLEDGLHLVGLHDIALDLELAGHEEALSVGLAGGELTKVLVGEGEGDCSWSVRLQRQNLGGTTKKSRRGEGSLPVGFSPRPLETLPSFLRSRFQLSVSPAGFLRVKAKTAPPCLMASWRSESLARAWLIWSKAAEAGNLAGES